MSVYKVNEDLIKAVSESFEKNKDSISSGYVDIDLILGGGFDKGSLYVLGGRPSMGKSSLAINIAINMLRAGKRILFYSSEISAIRLLQSMVTVISGESPFVEADMGNVKRALEEIKGFNLTIDDTFGKNPDSFMTEYSYSNVDFVIIDDFMYGTPASTHWKRGDFCQGMKEFAKLRNVPVLLLSPLSRDIESREDHRPVLSDLSDSKVIEMADAVLMLYRDGYYNYDTEDKEIAEVIVTKNIKGYIGTVILGWNDKRTLFTDVKRGIPA